MSSTLIWPTWSYGTSAPANPTRGIPLAGLEKSLNDALEDVTDRTNVDAARQVWQEAVAAPAWQRASPWLHGDLHPANAVVRDGGLTGVIDFGELCAGDPAADLSAAWILLAGRGGVSRASAW